MTPYLQFSDRLRMWELVYLEPFVYEFILFIVELRLPFLFFSIPPDGHGASGPGELALGSTQRSADEKG